MSPDRVVLTVPSKGEFARTVRMTAAELGARLGMTFDEVDDVRIAAEEAFVFASDRADAAESISFTFQLHQGALEVQVGPVPTCDGEPEDEARSEYATFILESVCDEFEILETGDTCSIRLLKRLS